MKLSSSAFVALLGCGILSSCGMVSTLKSATTSVKRATTSVKDATSSGLTAVSHFSVTDLMPSRVKVVEVREKDLQELPLGKERALAYESKRQQIANRERGFWLFRGPVDFKEPTLPANGGEPLDGSLLPPRAN